MIEYSAALRSQLTGEIAHWRAATATLDDPANFAPTAAWTGLEQYLGLAIRRHLAGIVERLRREADQLSAELRVAREVADLERLRRRIVEFRRRYVKAETVLDFYGDAVNTRTSPRLAALLGTCDVLATQSMTALLTPLGHRVPPVLSYIDKGLGASILKAGIRLWDEVLSPVAAIKIVRHNLLFPTSLLHESGHQAAHLTGWTAELAEMIEREVPDRGVSAAWAGWASEMTADVFAFVHSGYAAVAGLRGVVAGDEAAVFRFPPGDPHPIPYLRVLLGLQMCRTVFGPGPWDGADQTWTGAYPLDRAPESLQSMLRRSVDELPRLAELCLLTPLRAFGARPLVAIVDPTNVRPDRLAGLEAEAKEGRARSSHWLWQECVRLLALGGFRAATEPHRATVIAEEQEAWMVRLGICTQPAARSTAA